MSFFDNWKEFLIRAERQKLSTASQAAFYWIIAKFNAAHWAEEIELSDRELMRLTQIRSTKTITDVKSRLKLSGLIDFRTSKYYGTTYKLVQLASTSWDDTQTNTQGIIQGKARTETQGSAGRLVSYTRDAGEDVKTLRLQDTLTTTTTARAHAREGGEGTGETANPTPEIKVEQKPVAKVSHSVLNRWIQATYTQPTELDEEGLAALEKEFGSEKVFFAIGKANQYKKQPVINLRNVEVVLRGGDKPQKTKGEVRNDNTKRLYTDYDRAFGFDGED